MVAKVFLASALRSLMSAKRVKAMGDVPSKVEGATDSTAEHRPTRWLVFRGKLKGRAQAEHLASEKRMLSTPVESRPAHETLRQPMVVLAFSYAFPPLFPTGCTCPDA